MKTVPKNGVPDWMAALGVQKGEWLSLSKAQLRSLMRPDRPLKVQVYACGLLHTAGYRGEVATTRRNDKSVPLTASDIANELHFVAKEYYKTAGIQDKNGAFAKLKEDKAEIRAALAALEQDGVAERQTLEGLPLSTLTEDQLKRLPSGRTRILFWLKPRPCDPDLIRQEWEYRQLEIDDFKGYTPDDDDEIDDSAPDMSKVEVGKISPPRISNEQILFDFGVEDSLKAEIQAVPEYEDVIARAWAAARKVFLEVVNSSLPQKAPPSNSLPDGGHGSTPEGGTGSLPLIRSERKAERKGEKEEGSVGQSGAPDRPTDTPEARQRLQLGVRKLLIDELWQKLRQTPRPKLCEDILVALDGAPLPFLRTKIQARLAAFETMGLALQLAEEVGEGWRAQQGERDAAAAKQKEREAVREADRSELAQKVLDSIDDPIWTDEDRAWAREYIGRTKAAGGGA